MIHLNNFVVTPTENFNTVAPNIKLTNDRVRITPCRFWSVMLILVARMVMLTAKEKHRKL